MGLRGGSLLLRGGGGAGIRNAENGGVAAASGGTDSLVQPVRPARHLDGDHSPQRIGGQRLLPPLLHGTGARRWRAQSSGFPVSGGAGHLPVVPFRRSAPGIGNRVVAAPGDRKSTRLNS